MAKHIRFDWAMKRLLRNKANFDVLEGLLSVLLNDDITIKEILESSSNKETEEDKFNVLDILVKNANDELVLVEVQNERENDYFHRMNYAQAKLTSPHLYEGDAYGKIKKVISINIVYFDLGQGDDYVYVGKTEFKGLHTHDLLQLNESQKKFYPIKEVSDIYTTYYLLKVNNFDDIARNSLDEWIYFLKNSEIKDEFTARGLPEAREKLRRDNLTPAEKQSYEKYLHYKRISENVYHSAIEEGREIAKKEYEPQLKSAQQETQEERRQKEEERRQKEQALQKIIDLARMLKGMNIPPEEIAKKTGLTIEEIRGL